MDAKMAGKMNKMLFFRSLGNTSLSVNVMDVLKEYIGIIPEVGSINYNEWSDGELADRFRNYRNIEGKTLVFFECLKEERVMLQFLQLCWAAKRRYKAKNIIAVLFFIHYRRQDREDELHEHEIPRLKWLVEQMKASGIGHVIMVTPHSGQMKRDFEDQGISFTEIDLSDLFASRLKAILTEEDYKTRKIKVYSPDEGSIERCIEVAKRLGVGVLFGLKGRSLNNETRIIEADQEKINEIKKRFSHFPDLEYATPDLVDESVIIMVEDELDTAGSSKGKAERLRKYGAIKIILILTHGVCSKTWKEQLFPEGPEEKEEPFTHVIISNTIPRGEKQKTNGKIHDIYVEQEVAAAVFKKLNSIEV